MLNNINCHLKQLQGSSLRTADVTGKLENLPTVGLPLTIFAKPINPAASIRMVQTSLVTKVIKRSDSEYLLWTQSGSQYSCTIYDATSAESRSQSI